MAEKALIFGTETCPYTTSAREDYVKKGYEVEYVNVKTNPEENAQIARVFGREARPTCYSGWWGGHRRFRRYMRGLIPERQVASRK